MSGDTFYLKAGDTAPGLRRRLRTRGGPIDLSGATVTASMEPRLGGDPVFVDRPVVVEAPGTGVVRCDWQPGDTDGIGPHRLEFSVTYDDGARETVPNVGAVEVFISRRIGGEE